MNSRKKSTPLLTGADETNIFRGLFGAYPDSLIVADANGVIVLANSPAATLLGYSVDELVGLDVDVLVPDAVRPRHAAYRSDFGRDPRTRPMGAQMDLVARRKDGSEVMVEIALSPLQDRGLPFVVAAIRDIGAYPRVKQALRRAHYSEHLATLGRLAVDWRDPRMLLDEVPNTAAQVLAVEVATVYLLVDDRLSLRVASTFAALPGEAVGDSVENRPDTSLGFVLAQGRSIIVQDYLAERRFSVRQAYLDAGLTSALAVPLSDRGRIIGVLAVRSRAARLFGDDEVRFLESLGNLLASTLQRTQTEEQLKHAQRLETVGQLTGGIAHDFNNLLTVIQGNLQVLDELPLLAAEPSARQLVGAAARASRRGAELTSKLLAFSRRQVLQPQVVDVRAMLDSLADMLRRTLDQRIRITVQASSHDVHVLADPGQLESALLNIAINSRDAMPNGGAIAFAVEPLAELPEEVRIGAGEDASASHGFVAIAITDTGTGMSADARERAFEPFFTTKEAGRGTGLGLSTVYGFAKQSRGAVTLDSALGRGTTLTLYIPRPRGSAEPLADQADAGEAVPPGLSVLLVEDDPEVREVVRRFLEMLGCIVASATSGEQALRMLDASSRFDLLLTDIALGAGIRGTELAARAQARLPEIAVLLMSGFSAELLDADRESPAYWELLRKPCTREELGQAIVRAVRPA